MSDTGMGHPLSPMQQGMLYAALSAPRDDGVYIEQAVGVLQEALDAARLRACWGAVAARHAVLRTRFAWAGLNEARQIVEPVLEVPFAEEDWRSLTDGEKDSKFRAFLRADRARGFDFATGPLHRVALIRWNDADYRMIWTVHHTLVDGRAMAAVVREVLDDYDGCSAEAAEGAPPFAAYAEFVQGLDHAAAETFWRAELAGFEEPVELRLPRPPANAENRVNPFTGGADARLTLDAPLAGSLRALADHAGVTLNTVFQAAWAALLSRYSGQDDVVFGVTKAVRHGPAAAPNAVGLYINTLPFRVRIPRAMPVLAWLRDVREHWVRLRPYEHTPLPRIMAASELPCGTALFDTYLVFENGTFDALVRGSSALWPDRAFQLLDRTPEPLTLAVYAGEVIELVLEYDEKRFDLGLMRRMPGHLETLLRGMAERPDLAVDQIAMLPEPERDHVLFGWQSGDADAPLAPCLHQLFERSAGWLPEKTAVQQEGASLTYAQLDACANQLAHHLIGLGVQPDTPVGLCVPRLPEMMVGLLGILKAGGAYLPIDPKYPAPHMAYLIETSGASIVVTHGNVLPALPQPPAHIVRLDADSTRIREMPETRPDVAVRPDHLAYIIFTSGSTGRPKGVMIEHRSIVQFTCEAMRGYGILESDRVLQFSTLSFDAAAEEIWPCLTAGGTLVLRTEEMLSSAQAYLRAAERLGITVLDMPTALWHVLADELAHVPLAAGVRLVIFGGEAARVDKLELWRAHTPASVVQLNTYGPTETTVVATYTAVEAGTDTGEVPIGRPLRGVRAYVLDPKLRPAPAGVPGELYLGGAQVARGYIRRPDLTEAAFVPDPFCEGGRLYRTGDRVRLREDGMLVYLDRADRQVKVRGFRIELGEIETVLQQHPAVGDAAVVVREDVPGQKQLIAYVAAKDASRLAELSAALPPWLRERLPAHMQPTAFVALEKLPHTSSGKIDRRALPAPSRDAAAAEEDDTLEDGIELELARVWARVLGVTRVGPHDNFFDLGGHSLLAIVLLGQIERVFGKRLATVRIYQAPTLRELARYLREDAANEPITPLRPIQTHGTRLPLFVIGSTDVLDPLLPALGADQPVYSLNIFGLQRQDGKLPMLTLESIAERYIRDMRSVQPTGPYRLAAYCRDTMLAYEMAQQLDAAGERVARLISVDYFWEATPRYGALRRHARNWQDFGTPYLIDKVRRRRRLLYESYRRMRSRIALKLFPSLRANVPPTHHTALFINAYYDAADAYVPKPYAGKVTVLLASEWGIERLPEWERLARGGVEVHQVKACHYNLWQLPQAEGLARAIRQCLDGA